MKTTPFRKNFAINLKSMWHTRYEYGVHLTGQ